MSILIMTRVRHAIRVVAMAAGVFACSSADRDFAVAVPTTPTAPVSASRSDVVENGLASPAWQAMLTALVSQNHTNPLVASRAYALLGVAQYRAVQLADHGKGHSDDDAEGAGGRVGASDRGAVAGASAAVLTYLFPLQQQAFEDMVTTQRDASPGQSQRAFARGEAIGRTEAAGIVARAQTDGFNKSFTGT